MSEKINIDLKSFKYIFNKDKSYILPIVIMLVSIFLFYKLVIPQINTLGEVRKEAKELSLKLDSLKENLGLLANVDEEKLDSQLRVLNLSLPLKKDYIGILNSLYYTAQKTGVSLGSFSVAIGDITKSENNDTFPVIRLSLPINASIVEINSFLETISKTTPLSEASSVKMGRMSSNVDLSFYYKPLSVSTYNQYDRISPISQKGLNLINQLSEFQNVSSFVAPSVPTATSSAVQ